MTELDRRQREFSGQMESDGVRTDVWLGNAKIWNIG